MNAGNTIKAFVGKNFAYGDELKRTVEECSFRYALSSGSNNPGALVCVVQHLNRLIQGIQSKKVLSHGIRDTNRPVKSVVTGKGLCIASERSRCAFFRLLLNMDPGNEFCIRSGTATDNPGRGSLQIRDNNIVVIFDIAVEELPGC